MSFPVFCVIFSDFSMTGKWLPIFPGFPVRMGNVYYRYQWTYRRLGKSPYLLDPVFLPSFSKFLGQGHDFLRGVKEKESHPIQIGTSVKEEKRKVPILTARQ